MNTPDAFQAIRLMYPNTNIEITSRELLDHAGKQSATWTVLVTTPANHYVADGMAESLALAVENIVIDWRKKREAEAMAVQSANCALMAFDPSGPYPACKNRAGTWLCERCGRDVRESNGACLAVHPDKRWRFREATFPGHTVAEVTQ